MVSEGSIRRVPQLSPNYTVHNTYHGPVPFFFFFFFFMVDDIQAAADQKAAYTYSIHSG